MPLVLMIICSRLRPQLARIGRKKINREQQQRLRLKRTKLQTP